MLKFLTVLVVAASLVGCATKERREVRSQCSIEAMRQYPPHIERQLVNKTRAVTVPTGSMHCTTVGTGTFASTNCTAGTTTEYVPYTAVENVDLNNDARNAAEKSCADYVCLKRYGNTRCKVER